VYAAQVLLVFGAILYAFSLFTICLSYRFTKLNNVMAFRVHAVRGLLLHAHRILFVHFDRAVLNQRWFVVNLLWLGHVRL
jgi:hypothetical protein